MWEELNHTEVYAKKKIIPPESILGYLDAGHLYVPKEIDTDRNWVKNFCSAKKSKWFVEIDDDFLKEPRNYINIDEIIKKHFSKGKYRAQVAKINEFLAIAKYLIQTKDSEHQTKEEEQMDSLIYSLSEKDEITLETMAELLYGLLHARYIITNPGLIKMAQKFQRCEFGRCLRVGCKSSPVLPIGLSEQPFCFPVKFFCPLCHDVYNLPDEFEFIEHTDGAFFGKSFPSIFMLSFPQFCDESSFIHSKGPTIYKSKIKEEFLIPEENHDDVVGDDMYVPLVFDRRSVLLSSPFE